ncbi:MAG TPA: hypothetical protein VFU86_09620 [Terriglobales bacterium]|nr:hypothetical protein [Terriglobales bacterium]
MKRIALLSLTLLLGIAAAGQTQPTPAAPVSGSVQDQPTTPAYEPANQPLSGVETQDIGFSSESRNTLTPSLSIATGWDSNAPRVFNTTTEQSSGITNLSGGLTLNRDFGNGNMTTLGYLGGGQLYTVDSDLNSQFHRLDFSQRLVGGRWSFLMSDGFSYQKDAFSTSPPMLFPGLYFGPGGTLFRPGVTPGESIIGQNVGRVNNTSAGQVTYGFTRATTLTANVSYGMLQYFDTSAYLSNRQIQAGTGIDHRLGRNTIGVNYSFSRFSYNDLPVKFDSHTFQVLFSHVLTGRWSFEAGGGPAIVVSNEAFFNTRKILGSGQVSLHYHVPMTDWSVRYGRTVTNGSGVLPGAVTDDFGLNGSRKLSRSLTVNLSGGYARNSGAFIESRFNTLYVGAGISQALGRNATVSFGYTGQRQTGTTFSGLTRHAVLVTFNWSFRPVVLH